MFRCANMEHMRAEKFWDPKYDMFSSMRDMTEK